MPQSLPEGLLELLDRPSPCFIAALMPDGSPQLTETWVTTDGKNVVINIVGGMQKARNIERDPRVAVNVVDPDDVARFYAVRGRVVTTTSEGGWASIDEISHPDETRLIITIEADKITPPPGRVDQAEFRSIFWRSILPIALIPESAASTMPGSDLSQLAITA